MSKHWKTLKQYLNSLDRLLAELKPLVSKIARDNTVVILVCNLGQSSLLMNFVCGARSKGFDLGHVLVFATDQYTYTIAQGLGLNTYYDKTIFDDLPVNAANNYGGPVFRGMMWGKVIVTHLLSMLNVNFLFQDVDIIW